MANSSTHKDAKLMHLESDIQKIQVKTNMYINEYGEEGAFHLAREIIQNSIDEVIDFDSPGKSIKITYDEETDILTCEDDGRSFNESTYPMKVFCTTLQSGSKFFRGAGTDSSGEFGVGMTVVNALSDYFSMTAYREVEKTKHTIVFNEGKLMKDTVNKNASGKHGTIISFAVSKKYMGSNARMPMDKVINWLETMFYLNSANLKKKDVKAKVEIFKGTKLEKSVKIKPRPFAELMDKITPVGKGKNDFTSLCSFNGESKIVEPTKVLKKKPDGTTEIVMEDAEKTIRLDVAFRYDTKSDVNKPSEYMTFCNYTHTSDNGTHLDAFDEAFCRFMQKATNNALSEKQRNNLKISWEDCRQNLYCIVSLSTNAHVGFVGNAKQKIQCESLLKPMKDIITSGLEEYFENKQSVLNNLISVVKLNAKARLEAIKAKSTTKVDNMKKLDMKRDDKFIYPINTGKGFTEIFLVEGNSAACSVRNASDPKTQGIFFLRGVTGNPFKAPGAKILENVEWRKFTQIIGAGFGDSFDINKCKFNRINILTDADIDGYNISAGILVFLYMHMRPLIEAGRVYKVYSPLYSLDDKDNPFVSYKSDLVNIWHKKIVKHFKIRPMNRKNYLSKDELKEFLSDTAMYSSDLKLAAKSSGNVNKFLIENIAGLSAQMGLVDDGDNFMDIHEVYNNQKVITQMMNDIQSRYPEIRVNNEGRFDGVVNGSYVVIQISQRFYRKIATLIPIYKDYGYMLEVVENKGEPKTMSIAEFLDATVKLMPKIKTRYKGLGELNAADLRKTTMDINNRFSVQYTIEDVEKELELFEFDHGQSKVALEQRKIMMDNYKLKREDIDN